MSRMTGSQGGQFLVSHTNAQDIFTPEEFSAESLLIGRTADDFLRKEVLPHNDKIENHDVELMHKLMHKAGDLGLLGGDVPETYGGLGLDVPTAALIAEKLNYQQSFALSHEAHTVIATMPLMLFGSDYLKRKYLPKMASGEWIGSFCLSESGSGSDALGASAKATLSLDGTQWILTGEKMWITNAGFADIFTLFAKVDGDKFSCFMVERDTPGLSFGPEEHKLGMKGTSTCRVILDNVYVPKENLVGEVCKAHHAAFCALNMGRFKLEAGAVGGIKELLAICSTYTTQRKQFGKPIAEFGLIQAKLGEMCARLFALESAIYRLAGQLEGGFSIVNPSADNAPEKYHEAAEEFAIECGIVKVFGSELYSWAADEAIQIHGGYGYTEEFPVARAWRDQRLLRIGEGTNEVVRLNIVSTLLRRVKQGRIALVPPVALVEPDPNSDEFNLMAVTDASTIQAMRQHAMFLLSLAQKTFGDKLMDEQEVVAAIADIVIAVYVLESAWLRAQKLMQLGASQEKVIHAVDAARICTWEAMGRVSSIANDAVGRLVAHGADVTGGPDSWGAMIGMDCIGLRRDLAKAVLEKQAYPWS
ncbi:MAG: acyl-CoA dehydrogenase family protein [Chthonomonadales bacterium]